jgi:hypothetical protein
MRESIGAALAPIEMIAHDNEIAAVRGRMDERDFQSAWQAGREMTVEQSIQVSLNGSGTTYSANHAM